MGKDDLRLPHMDMHAFILLRRYVRRVFVFVQPNHRFPARMDSETRSGDDHPNLGRRNRGCTGFDISERPREQAMALHPAINSDFDDRMDSTRDLPEGLCSLLRSIPHLLWNILPDATLHRNAYC